MWFSHFYNLYRKMLFQMSRNITFDTISYPPFIKVRTLELVSYHFVVVLDCHFNPLHYAYQYYPLNKSFILSSSYFLDSASGGVVLVKEILSPSTSTYLSYLK